MNFCSLCRILMFLMMIMIFWSSKTKCRWVFHSRRFEIKSYLIKNNFSIISEVFFVLLSLWFNSSDIKFVRLENNRNSFDISHEILLRKFESSSCRRVKYFEKFRWKCDQYKIIIYLNKINWTNIRVDQD
jgi:hypothetical protein